MAKKIVKVIKRNGKVVKKVTISSNANLPESKTQNTVKTTDLKPNPTLVTLEDRQIAQMLADPRFNEAIPCVQSGSNQMKKITKRCGRCNAKRKKAKYAIMKQARTCIARMNKSQKTNLKKLLGAEKIQVMVANGSSVKPVVF
jgi:hypothetical protein